MEFHLFVSFLLVATVIALCVRRLYSPKSYNTILLWVSVGTVSTIIGIYTSIFFLAISALLHHFNRYWNHCSQSSPIHSKCYGVILCITLVAGFSLFNRPRFVEVAPWFIPYLATLGSSYLLFKAISFVLDTMQGKITAAKYRDILHYFFFFPCWLNGPMFRFNEYKKQLYKSAHPILKQRGFYYIVLGSFKVVVISSYIYPYINYAWLELDYSDFTKLLISLPCYYIFLYANFSGFCDIAVGTGALLGFKVPQNFRTPYLATNLADFWRRWHITLSRVLLDSIYTPLTTLLKHSAAKLGTFGTSLVISLTISCIGYIGTFAVSGFWHGSKSHFIVWGVWHGFGLCIRRIYRTTLNPDVFIDHYQYLKTPYNFICWCITTLYVTFGWALFYYPLDTLQSVWGGV